MTSMTQNPLDAFIKQIDTFRVQFQGDAKDWELIYQYLLMPLFGIDSAHDLSISQQERWLRNALAERLAPKLA